MDNNIKAIILAAGEGTRMKSNRPKVLHQIIDRSMLEYVIMAAKESGACDICVVIGHKGDLVRQAIEPEYTDTSFAVQAEQLGTGHAVKMAGDFISGGGNILLLYGDVPLLTPETLKDLIQTHEAKGNAVTMISVLLDDPMGYGRIVRDTASSFERIVEHKDANEHQLKIKEINTGVYIFKEGSLRDALYKLSNNNAQKEYYLTDTVEIIKQDGGKVGILTCEDKNEFLGINTRAQLAEVTALMRDRINAYHMQNGVTLVDPESTYIGRDIEIGIDTVIYPGSMIECGTKIGQDCVIGPNTRINASVIKDGVTAQYSTILKSEVGNHTNVGPYAYIRPNSKIGAHCKIGDFVEVKNSVIDDNSKASHLTYIGDSDVGKNVNFGCGTVTVNYDGDRKFRTVIEDNAFIGCNTNLVAPVVVSENAFTAAGSTITMDVPTDSLGIARSKQVNKPGWRKKRK